MVDLRLEKMFLILSCSFLVLSLGVVSGVLTVVDLASPGRRVNNLPGGLPNSPERRGVAEAGEDSVVVMPGVSSRSMTVVPRGREETPDLVGVPARWLDGVVRSGGDLGGVEGGERDDKVTQLYCDGRLGYSRYEGEQFVG